jgi:hypothetical protein
MGNMQTSKIKFSESQEINKPKEMCDEKMMKSATYVL